MAKRLDSDGNSGSIRLEYIRIELRKEFAVQAFHRGNEIALSDDKADVHKRSALRDHPDVDSIERAENPHRDTRREADVVAHKADDGLIFLDTDLRELAQLFTNHIEVARVVDRERNADLGGCDHIDGRFIAVKHLEYAPQKTVRHQHARGMHIDKRDLSLAGYRLDDVATRYGLRDDPRAI